MSVSLLAPVWTKLRRTRCSVSVLGLTYFVAIFLAGCSGGGSSSSSNSSGVSGVTVAIAGPADTLNTGAPFLFTATVNNAANTGVSWSVVEPGGGTITSDGVYTAPSIPGTYTVKAVSQADSTAWDTAPVTVVTVGEGHIPGYDVGVDYHAFGTDFLHTAFVTIYDQPAVRQNVRVQLQGMADRGATFLQTAIWFVTEPGTTNFGETWRATFPMTDQEAANLRAYAQDVASIQGAGGNTFRLDLALNWLGAADFTIGSPTTGLGNSNLSATEFISRVQVTTGKVVAAVSDVTRPDGVRLVDRVFLDCGVTIPAPGEPDGNPNEGWFLTANYPGFVSTVSQPGLTPAVYFNSDFSQAAVLDDSYVDSAYPILNGHRSMFWIYRGMKFMVDNGLPLPSRIDFAGYITSTGASYDQLLQRILDDADATLPSLGAPRAYGAAETYYLADPTQRLQYAQAFAKQAAQSSRLQRVSFWTTPDSGGKGVNAAYPFTIEDFLPQLP